MHARHGLAWHGCSTLQAWFPLTATKPTAWHPCAACTPCPQSLWSESSRVRTACHTAAAQFPGDVVCRNAAEAAAVPGSRRRCTLQQLAAITGHNLLVSNETLTLLQGGARGLWR